MGTRLSVLWRVILLLFLGGCFPVYCHSKDGERCRYEIAFLGDAGGIPRNQIDLSSLMQDFLKELSRRQQCYFNIRILPSGRAVKSLLNGSLEGLVWAAPESTDPELLLRELRVENLEKLGLIEPFYRTPLIATVRSGFFSKMDFATDSMSTDGLNDLRIGSHGGSVFTSRSYKYFTQHNFLPVHFNNAFGGLKSLAIGRVDLFYTTFPVFYSFLTIYPGTKLKLLQELPAVEVYLVFFKKDEGFEVEEIDKIILEMKRTNEIKEIFEKQSDLNNFIW